MVWNKRIILALYRTPRIPTILTHEHVIRAHIRDANEDTARSYRHFGVRGECERSVGARVGIERDPRNTHDIGPKGIGGRLEISPDGGKRGDVGPGQACVRGSPETVT